MLIVRVELHSAITGIVTEIARAEICNIGGTPERGNYIGRSFRGKSKDLLDKRTVVRTGRIENHPRLTAHVFHLVVKTLIAMGYGKPSMRNTSTV
jgi:hypothetical protein